MNLIDQAVQDQSFVLKDIDNGFGYKIVFISPTDTRYGDNDELIGKTNDIGLAIDPNMGTLVQGRTFEFDISLVDLKSVIGLIPDDSWRCEITNKSSGKVYVCHPVASPANDNILQIAKYEIEGITTT